MVNFQQNQLHVKASEYFLTIMWLSKRQKTGSPRPQGVDLMSSLMAVSLEHSRWSESESSLTTVMIFNILNMLFPLLLNG